jgi:hypothetical protein
MVHYWISGRQKNRRTTSGADRKAKKRNLEESEESYDRLFINVQAFDRYRGISFISFCRSY